MNPVLPAPAGGADLAFACLSADGTRLDFTSLIGGSSSDDTATFAIDSTGSLLAAGRTNSLDFHTVLPLQGTLPGSYGAFVVKLACGPDTAPPDQGNVLLAARSGGDVALTWPGAPASLWRVFRDDAKETIGTLAMASAVSVTSLVDAGAVVAPPSLAYYSLRGLSPCSRTTGP